MITGSCPGFFLQAVFTDSVKIRAMPLDLPMEVFLSNFHNVFNAVHIQI